MGTFFLGRAQRQAFAGMFRLVMMLCYLLAAVQAFVPPAGSLQTQRLNVQRQSAISMTALAKHDRTNQRRRAYNKMYKSEMKTAIKKVLMAVKLKDYDSAFVRLSSAMSIIDKNVKRNLVHKNNAARKKSNLTLKVKALEPSPAQ